MRRGQVELTCKAFAAGLFCNSYAAEGRALAAGLAALVDQLEQDDAHSATVWALTDSQSLLRTLEGGPTKHDPPYVQQVWTQVHRIVSKGVPAFDKTDLFVSTSLATWAWTGMSARINWPVKAKRLINLSFP